MHHFNSFTASPIGISRRLFSGTVGIVARRRLDTRRLGLKNGDAAFSRRTRAVLDAVADGIEVAASGSSAPQQLAHLRNDLPSYLVDFGVEGLGFTAASLDAVLPFTASRLGSLRAASSTATWRLLALGAGMASHFQGAIRAKSPGRIGTWFESPLLWDGYGFAKTLFSRRKMLGKRLGLKKFPPSLIPHFQNGVGRALWFIRAGTPVDIRDTIEILAGGESAAELWYGVGVAAAFMGGVPESALHRLLEFSGENRLAFAEGVYFAASTRADANGDCPATDLATRSILGRSTLAAADTWQAAEDAVRQSWLASQRPDFGPSTDENSVYITIRQNLM